MTSSGMFAELPDRTSPDDRPEMMLVSADEMRSILLYHLSDNVQPTHSLNNGNGG
jgi:hypothetical protein